MASGNIVPAGWYDDPASRRLVRWWNGVAWTQHTAVKPGYESDEQGGEGTAGTGSGEDTTDPRLPR